MKVVAIMQNPSKASAFSNDPTINKWAAYLSRWYPELCVGGAEKDAVPREDGSAYRYRLTRTWRSLSGVLTFDVGNVFAYRATSPHDLWTAHRAGNDIVGPDNADHIRAMVAGADLVIAAWGVHTCTAEAAGRLIERVLPDVKLHVLALSQDGRPKHPLYLPGDLRPTAWRRAA